jgi:hypothetical protein
MKPKAKDSTFTKFDLKTINFERKMFGKSGIDMILEADKKIVSSYGRGANKCNGITKICRGGCCSPK